MAQPVSIGVKSGVRVTGLFNLEGRIPGSDDTKRPIVGPTVEFHAPLGLSLEVDALYRPAGYEYQIFSIDTISRVRTNADLWQFPALMKWAFLPGPIKPFVDTGITVQRVFGLHQIQVLTVVPSHSTTTISNTSLDLANDTTVGFAFGAGIELKIHRLRIDPEFRYTRWSSEAFHNPIQNVLSTNLNQGDFLLGITF